MLVQNALNGPGTSTPNALRLQGWHSGESTRLPPMWPRFDSWTRRHIASYVG